MIHEENLIKEFIKAYPIVEDVHRYIIFTPSEDPEYCVLLFRTVKEVHCYYKGYGLAAKKKHLSAFDTAEEILQWSLSQRNNMEMIQHEELSPIDKIFLGLDWEDEEDEN